MCKIITDWLVQLKVLVQNYHDWLMGYCPDITLHSVSSLHIDNILKSPPNNTFTTLKSNNYKKAITVVYKIIIVNL